MYDFKMLKNEKIELIDDFFQLYIDEAIKDYTVIITNMRLLILDFPNTAKNFKEDLRASQRLYYIRKKVIIFEIRLEEIKKVVKEKEFLKLYVSDEQYLLINNNKNSREIIKKIL